MKRKLARELCWFHGWVKGAHYNAINFLLERHDLVIAPALEVKKLCYQSTHNINCKVARKLYTWKHLCFRQRLKSAAFRYPGHTVVEPKTKRDESGNLVSLA